MSNKLALSAALSVLMMAAYVLFGAGALRAPLGPDAIQSPIAISAPAFDAKALLR